MARKRGRGPAEPRRDHAVAADHDLTIIQSLRIQRLAGMGLDFGRAAMIAPLAFGEVR